MDRQVKFTKVFEDPKDFAAYREAEKWLISKGFSVGRMQRSDPVGVKLGDYDIQKWGNLRQSDKETLDGTITGDKRHGPVTVQLYCEVEES
jgi:hypothetical protein